ncbi:MAG: hypothetical protein GY803_16110, partial [Chloroflexi bacterium]|nr:hypothetical protein [Chloroflexota bacterium]
FLRARCVHLEGHFLGYQLLRVVRSPLREMPRTAIPLIRSFLRRGGAPLRQRLAGFKIVNAATLAAFGDPRRNPANDPVARARAALPSDATRLRQLEDAVEQEIDAALAAALQESER